MSYRTLIFTQCFIQDEEKGRLAGVSLELNHRLNPGFDLLLIDNASPLDPLRFIIPHDDRPIDIFRFPDSIGHFGQKFKDETGEPRDGPGRAIMTGIQMAFDGGYDRLVITESDALFARPFEEGFSLMKRPAATLPRTKWGYLENNVMWFADLRWLQGFDLIGKYGWEKQTKETQDAGNEGERHYERILQGHLDVLPFKGGRGEGYTNESNLRAIYPDGVDFLTHVSRETFAEFLRLNGFDDLVEKL